MANNVTAIVLCSLLLAVIYFAGTYIQNEDKECQALKAKNPKHFCSEGLGKIYP